jgi:5-methylcytosine-specific restriction endonuclease McrA
MAKKPKKPLTLEEERKRYLIAWLRRGSYRWPYRNEALKLARVARGLYQCASCSEVFKKQDVKLDHIKPVVDPRTGYVDLNTYADRMFVGTSGWQVLCSPCHDGKTQIEKEIRKKYRKKD